MREPSIDLIRHEKNRPCVYFLRCKRLVKIGKSTYGNLETRLRTLQSGNPDLMILVGLIPDKLWTYQKSQIQLEQILHKRFAHLRKTGEWFEWTDEIKNFLRSQEYENV